MLSNQSLAALLTQPGVRRDDHAPLAAYAGLWKGTFRPDGDAAAIPFTMRQEGVVAGVHPVLMFPTQSLPHVAVRLVEASATAYEAITAPFHDPSVNATVTLQMSGARHNNRMTGRFTLRREDGDVVQSGTFAAARYAAAAQVNYRW